MERLNFTKSSSIFEIIIHKYNFGLMIVGKLVWQQEEVRKEDISIALMILEQFFTSEFFRDTLEKNLIDPSLQYNVTIQSGIFHCIYHIGCAFNFYSIVNNGLVLGGQDLSRRQTIFFLPIDPRDKNHKDPEYIDFSVPRRAKYVHSAWKRHQDAVLWVDIDFAIREG